LDIGVLGYIGIVQHKEHSPEVLSIPPGTPCIQFKQRFHPPFYTSQWAITLPPHFFYQKDERYVLQTFRAVNSVTPKIHTISYTVLNKFSSATAIEISSAQMLNFPSQKHILTVHFP